MPTKVSQRSPRKTPVSSSRSAATVSPRGRASPSARQTVAQAATATSPVEPAANKPVKTKSASVKPASVKPASVKSTSVKSASVKSAAADATQAAVTKPQARRRSPTARPTPKRPALGAIDSASTDIQPTAPAEGKKRVRPQRETDSPAASAPKSGRTAKAGRTPASHAQAQSADTTETPTRPRAKRSSPPAKSRSRSTRSAAAQTADRDDLEHGFVPKAPPPSAPKPGRASDALLDTSTSTVDAATGRGPSGPTTYRSLQTEPVRAAPGPSVDTQPGNPTASAPLAASLPLRIQCQACSYPLPRTARFCRRCGIRQRFADVGAGDVTDVTIAGAVTTEAVASMVAAQTPHTQSTPDLTTARGAFAAASNEAADALAHEAQAIDKADHREAPSVLDAQAKPDRFDAHNEGSPSPSEAKAGTARATSTDLAADDHSASALSDGASRLATPEPVAVESATVEPVSAEPVTAEPVTAEPVTAEPVTAEPVTAEPVTAEPVTAEPVAVEPVAVEPVTVEPVTAEPVSVDSDSVGSGTRESAAPPPGTVTSSPPHAEQVAVARPVASAGNSDNTRDCGVCGLRLPGHAKFCRACGALQLTASTAQDPPGPSAANATASMAPVSAEPSSAATSLRADAPSTDPDDGRLADRPVPEPVEPKHASDEPIAAAPDTSGVAAPEPYAVEHNTSEQIAVEPPLASAALITCRACHAHLPAVARFCMFCATPLNDAAVSIEISASTNAAVSTDSPLEHDLEHNDLAVAADEPTPVATVPDLAVAAPDAPGEAELVRDQAGASPAIEIDPSAINEPDASSPAAEPEQSASEPGDDSSAGAAHPIVDPAPAAPVSSLAPDVVERLDQARREVDLIARSLRALTAQPAPRPSPMPTRHR